LSIAAVADQWRTETVYAITDVVPHQTRPGGVAAWIRGHRQIENGLHRVRDVTFAEDLSQVRTGSAPQVTASPAPPTSPRPYAFTPTTPPRTPPTQDH